MAVRNCATAVLHIYSQNVEVVPLWSSVTFCYIYGDFFGLFKTGALQSIISGRTPVGAVSEGVLLGMSISVAIPSSMVFLSLVLPPRLNRWMNIILGA